MNVDKDVSDNLLSYPKNHKIRCSEFMSTSIAVSLDLYVTGDGSA
jgi:hypothetical protein